MADPTSYYRKELDGRSAPVETTVAAQTRDADSSSDIAHGRPGIVGHGGETTVEEIEGQGQGWFAYFRTKNFYIALILG